MRGTEGGLVRRARVAWGLYLMGWGVWAVGMWLPGRVFLWGPNTLPSWEVVAVGLPWSFPCVLGVVAAVCVPWLPGMWRRVAWFAAVGMLQAFWFCWVQYQDHLSGVATIGFLGPGARAYEPIRVGFPVVAMGSVTVLVGVWMMPERWGRMGRVEGV